MTTDMCRHIDSYTIYTRLKNHWEHCGVLIWIIRLFFLQLVVYRSHHIAMYSAAVLTKIFLKNFLHDCPPVDGSIVWAFRRLKKPRSWEMSARSNALHSVCPQMSPTLLFLPLIFCVVSRPLSVVPCFHRPCGCTHPNTRPVEICVLVYVGVHISMPECILVKRPSIFIAQFRPLVLCSEAFLETYRLPPNVFIALWNYQ